MATEARRLAGEAASTAEQRSADQLESFDDLYRAFFPRLVMEIHARTGDRALAEDIAQETLTRAYNAWAELDPSRPIWPWLKTVATNLSIDQSRRRCREVISDVEAPSGIPESFPLEDSDLLHRAMKELPVRQRIAMSLKYLDDWDNAQGAAFLGVSRSGFEQLLHRARLKLLAHYKRLSQEAMGLALIPLRGLRSLSFRARRAVAATDPSGQFGIAIPQAAHVLVALALATGAVAVHVDRPSETPRITREVVHRHQASGHKGSPKIVAAAGVTSGSGGASSILGDGTNRSSGNGTDSPTADRVVDDLTEPNKNVKQPEDTKVFSVALSPSYGTDRTMFASGLVHCRLQPCPPVLFRSTDGGRTWTRLKAGGLSGTSILLPPAYNLGDHRIFAMSSQGLQVSRDGGQTFEPAAVGGAPYAVGSVAISPAFNSGDPSILIGSQNMMRYDDSQRVVSPAPYTSLPGPLEPAYAPSYPADHRLIVGAVRADPMSGGIMSVVFRCSSETKCSDSFLGPYGSSPKVRLSPDFSRSNALAAFIEQRLFVSHDGAVSFAEVTTPWESEIRDVSIDQGGRRILVAVAHWGSKDDGLYRSIDGGMTWTHVPSSLFRHGVETIDSFGNTTIVGLWDKGLACSTDGGSTWSRRCK